MMYTRIKKKEDNHMNKEAMYERVNKRERERERERLGTKNTLYYKMTTYRDH